MPATTITIISSDGTETTEPTGNYRATSAHDENALSDSPEGAARFARAHVPNDPDAVWAIWPTGAGHWAIREAVRRDPKPPLTSGNA